MKSTWNIAWNINYVCCKRCQLTLLQKNVKESSCLWMPGKTFSLSFFFKMRVLVYLSQADDMLRIKLSIAPKNLIKWKKIIVFVSHNTGIFLLTRCVKCMTLDKETECHNCVQGKRLNQLASIFITTLL